MAESTLTPRVRTRCQRRIHLAPGASAEPNIDVDPSQFATNGSGMPDLPPRNGCLRNACLSTFDVYQEPRNPRHSVPGTRLRRPRYPVRPRRSGTPVGGDTLPIETPQRRHQRTSWYIPHGGIGPPRNAIRHQSRGTEFDVKHTPRRNSHTAKFLPGDAEPAVCEFRGLPGGRDAVHRAIRGPGDPGR